MAWTANTFSQKIRAIAGMGYKGEPFMLHQYLQENVTHREGDVVIDTTTGSLVVCGDNPNGTIIGVLPALTGRGPLDTTVRSRTTLAALPDRTKYDDDKSIAFYAWVSGNIFVGHLVTDATNDETADSGTVNDLCSVRKATNDLAFGTAGNEAGRILGFVNPQITTVENSVAVLRPGPVVDGPGAATGTKNPLITAMPTAGIYF